MATRRKAAPRKARKRKAKRRTVRATRARSATVAAPLVMPVETSEQALAGIAQDAVLILRRGMRYHADRAIELPQTVQMRDCVALLRLVAEIGPAAKRGADGGAPADFSRLSPEELAQYAALSLKVAYA